MSRKAAASSGDAAQPFDLDAFRQVGHEEGLSLDQLGAALAGMLETGDDPYAAAPSPAGEALNEAALDTPLVSSADDACELTPRSILEALLFVGDPQNRPLAGPSVASLMRGVRASEIDACVRSLNADYERRNCPYMIVAEGAGYRLKLRPRFDRLRDQFHGKDRQARLSQAAIEVLAAVAYRGALSRDEVSRLRGKPSGHILTQLVRRQLLQLERDDATPRRVRYAIAPRFFELFGLTSLSELPRSPDLEDA
jgi:segregation and condensation protein B